MAAGRLLLLPSSFVLLFYANLLSAFLGEQSAVSEGELKRIDTPEVKSYLQVDGFATANPADNGIERRILSPVLSSYPLTFEPPSLDFQAQNVGMPRLQRVRITNPSQTQTLQLTSISGDSPDFHPSFFKSKVVKGGDWTTFDVVFLARIVGAVQNTLYIHTSMGTFDYKVQGIGTPNPFRLRSLLGARIPLNATYSPLITMYNPFSSSLQITEMYSSGGELHIELLTGQSQGSKTLWEIRPYETKPIARANFFGRTAINHTSFIRVKTSHTASPSLVLPVEVEVAGSPGLFLSRELLDFGMLKTGESKMLPLYVLNSEAHQVHIRSISIEPENPAVVIEYTTTVMKPGSKYSKIALVNFHSDRVTSSKQQSGRLVIRAEGRQSHQLEMPYVSHVLHGAVSHHDIMMPSSSPVTTQTKSLSYEKSQTLFRVGRPPFNPVIRNISLSNQFDIPVVLYDVRLSSRAQEYFSVVAFRGPYIIPASSEWHQPFSISFLATSSDCLFNTTLRLSTNSSFFNIPLHCYDGRVKFVLENPEDDVLDYGVLEEADIVSKTFTLHNPNPIRVSILSYYVSDNLPHTTVELIAIQPANTTKDRAQAKKMPIRPPFTVDPGFIGIFRVNITHPKRLGTFSGEIIITTSFEKVWHIPVYYKTAVGSLKVIPERIVFQPTFPFGTSRLPLMIKSLYPQPITITTVDPVPADSRFYAVNERIHRFPALKPNALTELATLVFDPLLGNRENVYLGVGRGSSWSPTSSGGKQRDPGVDMREFAALWSVWSSLEDQKLTSLNFNISVRTELGTDVKIPAEASLSWPHLFATQLLEFSPTTVGNSTIHTLELSNPTSWPLTIQPVLLHHYSRPHTVVNLLADRMDPELHSVDFSQSSSSFAFHVDSHTTDSAISSTVIPPHSKPYPITVAFTPKMDLQAASLLLIRNNLTVLDYVLLEGRGSQGLFTVNNVPPGSEPLLFEFGSTLLEKCQTGSLIEPMVLMKSFQMHNAGSTPLNLLSVEVGGGGCEEHGFAVANCDKQISIPPNKTKTIEISFTPDFTLSRISNTLRIQTSDGTEMLFPLLAVLPHTMLAACYAMQPRPEWEKRMAWFSVPFWLFALLALLIVVLVKTNFHLVPARPSYGSDTELPTLQATGSPIFDLSYLTRSVHTTLSQKISALRASVHPETLRPSRRCSADSSHYVAGAQAHKPLRKADLDPLKATTASTQDMKSGQISQPEQQVLSDPRNRSLFSGHSNIAPMSTVETATSKVTVNTTGPPMRYELSTDSRTGMREVSTLGHFTMEHGDMISAEKSSSVDADDDYSHASTPPGLIPGDTSTTAGGTPPSSRKIRGTRKMSGRLQRSETSIPPLPTQTVLVQMESKADQLERKESESSIRSTDSESTSSSSDKSEDNGTGPGESQADQYEIKLKPPPPLTKEPNTGQSVPITDAPEDTSVMKNEAIPELPTVYRKKEKESLPSASSKVKGKKKLKQQMKREEKLRRRERERERERGKEQLREEQKLFEKDNDSFEYIDKESSTSNSTENFEDECVEQLGEIQGSIRTEDAEILPPEIKGDTNRDRMPQNFKTAEYIANPGDQLTLEESPECEMETSASPELFVLAYQDEQILPRSDDSEASDSSPPPPSAPIVQPRTGAVPSSAIKARGRSSKPQVEEVLLDPFSRNPDRSTYASKKASTKRQPEKPRAALEATSVKSHPKMEGLVAMDAASEAEAALSKQQSSFPLGSEASSPGDAEDIAVGELGRMETDGPSHLGVSKLSSQLVPTSPHELAASLLSNMQKKLKIDKDRSGVADDDAEESKTKHEELKSANINISSGTAGNNSFVVGRTKPTRQHSGDRSSQKPMPHFSRFRPPTTLSLDAEPFYPSADFQQKLHRVHFDQRNRQKYGNTLGDYIPPSLNVPPGFSPEEAGVAFQSQYPPEKKPSKWGMDHPQQHMSKGTTPSPPYTTALGDGQHFNYMDPPGLDPQETFGYSNDPLFYDAVEDPRALYAAGGGGSGMPGVGMTGRRVGGGAVGVDPRETVPPPSRLHTMEQTDLLLAAAAKRQQQQQQALAAHRRAARERSAAAYPVPGQGSLWDNPNSYRLQALQEEEGLTLQQQQLLRLYYHRQARKSAETLSSLNQPPLYRPSRSAVFPPEVNQPSSANLWDTDLLDLSPPRHSLDDSFLSEAVHAQQLRQQHLLQEQAARTMRHAQTRRRTYSGESDLGGEMVSNFQSVCQTPTSPNHPSLNRAPGTFSGFEQPRRARSSQPSTLDSSGWPSEPTEPTSSSGWGGIWSLDSPFSSGDKDQRGSTHPSPPSSQQTSSQPFTGGTYDLFENQSIWSLSSGDSSGLLSWAQDKNK